MKLKNDLIIHKGTEFKETGNGRAAVSVYMGKYPVHVVIWTKEQELFE